MFRELETQSSSFVKPISAFRPNFDPLDFRRATNPKFSLPRVCLQLCAKVCPNMDLLLWRARDPKFAAFRVRQNLTWGLVSLWRILKPEVHPFQILSRHLCRSSSPKVYFFGVCFDVWTKVLPNKNFRELETQSFRNPKFVRLSHCLDVWSKVHPNFDELGLETWTSWFEELVPSELWPVRALES